LIYYSVDWFDVKLDQHSLLNPLMKGEVGVEYLIIVHVHTWFLFELSYDPFLKTSTVDLDVPFVYLSSSYALL